MQNYDDIDLYSLVLHFSEFPQDNQAIHVSPGTMKREPIVIPEHVLTVFEVIHKLWTIINKCIFVYTLWLSPFPII